MRSFRGFTLLELHHVVITFSGISNVMSIYINGTLIDTGNIPAGAPTDGPTPLRIGARVGTPSNFFKGVIDDIRFYNRELTASEVVDRCNGTSISNGSVAAWDFNEGTGATVNDSSGNNNHGTILGATWVAR